MQPTTRRQIEFVVKWEGLVTDPPTASSGTVYMLGDSPDPKPKTTSDKTKAAVFRFNLTASHREQVRIDRMCHELVGGLLQWVELQKALDSVESQLRDTLSVELFKTVHPLSDSGVVSTMAALAAEGKGIENMPKPGTPMELALASLEITRQLSEQLSKTDSGLAYAQRELKGQLIQFRWWATWAVLAVSVPPGWEDMAEMVTSDEGMQSRIHAAWLDARQEHEEGK